MNFLKKVKNKSLEQQKMLSLGVAFALTFCIFAVWLLTVIYGFSGFDNQNNKENTASPINIVTKQVKSLFSGKETYISE